MADRTRRKHDLELEAAGKLDSGSNSDAAQGLIARHPESADPPGTPAETPHERLHVHRGFRSRFLPSRRDLIVYVPPGYHSDHPSDSGRRYPVLYLHDGQNLFDPLTSFVKGQTWRIRETADAAIMAGEVEPLVIVGIYNTGDQRLAEYTPERDWQMGGGEADLYGDLLTQELMPWIGRHYRVLAGREHTGVGGSSLGGLVSLYFGLRYPGIFGRLAVMSPSVWWNHRSILRLLDETAPQMTEKPRIWTDIGDHEGRVALRDAELLAKKLKAGGWQDGETMHFEKARGGTHDEASWALRVEPMLRFLFPSISS